MLRRWAWNCRAIDTGLPIWTRLPAFREGLSACGLIRHVVTRLVAIAQFNQDNRYDRSAGTPAPAR